MVLIVGSVFLREEEEVLQSLQLRFELSIQRELLSLEVVQHAGWLS